jgi:hypothetical protein
MTATGQVARQEGERGFYASVTVQLDATVTPAEPTHATEWLPFARAGIVYALSVVGASERAVHVTDIASMPCDTTATTVAIAAARATWQALDIPFPSEADDLDDLITRSVHVPADELGSPFDSHLS